MAKISGSIGNEKYPASSTAWRRRRRTWRNMKIAAARHGGVASASENDQAIMNGMATYNGVLQRNNMIMSAAASKRGAASGTLIWLNGVAKYHEQA